MAEIPTPTTGYSSPSGDRPLGVTILAILQLLGGVLSIIAGLGVIALAAFIPGMELLFIALGAFTLILGFVRLWIVHNEVVGMDDCDDTQYHQYYSSYYKLQHYITNHSCDYCGLPQSARYQEQIW